MKVIIFFVVTVFLFPIFSLAQPAFPDAAGYGATSIGGRGGDVYHVTKLVDDNSQGTLRHGLTSANGPRTIVFDVGGIIHLKSRLKIKKSFLTIAGQTAPGGGITLAGSAVDIKADDNNGNEVEITDIIIRYLTFRVGDFNVKDRVAGTETNGNGEICVPFKAGKGNKHLGALGGDGVSAENANRLIIDHCTFSWGMDESVDVSYCKNVTVQNCFISQGLLKSYHTNGNHNRGFLTHSDKATVGEIMNGSGGYTIANNLIAHFNMRSILVGSVVGPTTDDPNNPNSIFQKMDFVNNVIYNWGERSGHTSRANSIMNYIGNYLIAGPSTDIDMDYTICKDNHDRDHNLNIAMRKEDSSLDRGPFLIYHSGNFMDTDKNSTHNGSLVGNSAFAGFDSGEIKNSPLYLNYTNILSAQEAYQKVIDESGSSFHRDAIDIRLVNETISRSGGFINSQDDIGGLTTITNGTPDTDTDQDGMPDDWEVANGLNPNNSEDRNNTNLSSDAYTNLEVYLNSIVDSTLSVQNFNAIDITIFPVPVKNNEITIQLPKSINIETIKIYDILGKEVFSKSIESFKNEILINPNLSKGAYILKITTSEKGSISKKLIIE